MPIADEEYATVQEGAFVNTAGTILVVLTILWLALRSGRLISGGIHQPAGRPLDHHGARVGLVGALNLISVAFAVLFIGLGVDFGIQFSVRYRAERHEIDNLHAALLSTARYVGAPLTLAAAATAAGFMSFLPTDYKGVSELGLLAGLGMIVAFLTSITVIPALLMLFNPPGEPKEMGYKALAPVDRFMERQRIRIIVGTGLVVAAGLPLLYFLQFDFNPLNLRSPKVESVATFLDLRSDPAHRRELDLRARAKPRGCQGRHREALQAARGLQREDHRELHSRPIRSRSSRRSASSAPSSTRCCSPIPARSRRPTPTTSPRSRPRPTACGRPRTAPRPAPGAIAAQAARRRPRQARGRRRGAARPRAQTAMIPPLDTALDELRDYLQAQPVDARNAAARDRSATG